VYGNWNSLTTDCRAYYKPCTLICLGLYTSFTNGEEVLENQQHFRKVLCTFKPCIDGFPFCKPIVQVDGTFLYIMYRGTLIVAIAQDERNKIFPIAFAIVEGEIAEAWFFFLKNLRTHVTPQQNLCLMSDCHNSICAVFNRPNSSWTEGNCVQVFCIRYIAQNFTKRFKNTILKKDLVNMGKLLHVNLSFSFFWLLIIHTHY